MTKRSPALVGALLVWSGSLLAAPAAGQGMVDAVQARSLKAQGDQALGEGDPASAERLYRQALKASPDFTEASRALGKTLVKLKRYPEAAAVFQEAVRRNPNYHKGHYRLAFALRKAGRLAEAAEAYGRYIQVRPNDPDGHYGLAQTHQRLGDSASAIASYSEYIRRETRPNEAKWVAKARAKITQLGGSPPAAKTGPARPPPGAPAFAAPVPAAGAPPLATSRTGSAARIREGDRAFDTGQYGTALDVYRGVLETDTENIEARYKLGVTLAVRGEIPAGIAELEGVLQRDPTHESAGRNLPRLRLAVAERSGTDPSEPQGTAAELIDRARAHLAAHDYGLAVRLLERARATGGEPSLCHRLVGEALLARGETDGALSAFEAALGPGPEGARAHRGLAQAHERAADLQRAAYHLALFLDLAHSEPDIGALEEADAERALEAIRARAPSQAAPAVPPAASSGGVPALMPIGGMAGPDPRSGLAADPFAAPVAPQAPPAPQDDDK